MALSEPTLNHASVSPELRGFLRALPGGQCKLVSSDGEEHEFPPEVFEILLSCASAINQGASFFALSGLQQMTTMAASEMLGVSRPHLIKLLDQGDIPFSLVGKHRRLTVKDVLHFKESRKASRKKALNDLHTALGDVVSDE